MVKVPKNSCVTTTFGDREIVAINGDLEFSYVKEDGVDITAGAWVGGNAWQVEMVSNQPRELFFLEKLCPTLDICKDTLPIDWNTGEIGGIAVLEENVIERSESSVTREGEELFGRQMNDSENRILVATGNTFLPLPSRWTEGPLEELTYFTPDDIQIQSEIKDQYCPGESFTIDVKLVGKCKMVNTETVSLVNELTGEVVSSVDISEIAEDPAGREATTSFDFTVPNNLRSASSIPLVSIKVDDEKRTINASIGNTAEDLSLQSISDIDEVCQGDRFNPDVVAQNDGDCDTEVSLEITNDVNDEVISVDPSRLSSSSGSPGTSSFFINSEVPEVSKDVSDIEYTAELIRTVSDTSNSDS